MKEPKGELADWLNLILGNEEEIVVASERNEKIAKVNEENKKLSTTQEMQDWYWLEEMAIYDENTKISVATKRGEEIGLKKGKEIGRQNEKLEMAKKLLKMKMPIEQIIEVTGLSREEIEKVNSHIKYAKMY